MNGLQMYTNEACWRSNESRRERLCACQDQVDEGGLGVGMETDHSRGITVLEKVLQHLKVIVI